MFTNNKLRVIDEDVYVQEENWEELNRITLDEEVTQSIVSKEAIAATDASVKEINMAGGFLNGGLSWMCIIMKHYVV